MSEDIRDRVLTIWPVSGPPIHFDRVWGYRITKDAVRFNYKDVVGRVMLAEFDVKALAGCALEQ